MFDKFGEFDSAEEINRAAAAQLKEGDLDAIKTIARGERPIVYGIEGTAVGWILESEGNIIAAKVGVVGQSGIKPGVKYTITANRELVEVQDETESN